MGRNTRRLPCSQSAYVPAHGLEDEVEALYDGVRIPPALERRLEGVLRVEVAERERHRAEAAVFLGRRLRQLATERRSSSARTAPTRSTSKHLRREQARINDEVGETEARLGADGEKLAQA